VLGLNKAFQAGQAGLPERAVRFQLRGDRSQRTEIQVVEAVPSLAALANRCALPSRRRCFEIFGPETRKVCAMPPTGWLPRRKRSSAAWRVGSARALKIASGEYEAER